MLDGFTTHSIDVGEARLHVLTKGEGPPVVLLHGYPQTHIAWAKVAPHLARHFTTVLLDLRGYGDSSGPPSGSPESVAYAKRTMARDVVAVMDRLGHESFAIAGHDRGGRVAYRLALDEPERVSRLALLDIVPTLEAWERMDGAAARATYHWSFLAVPAPVPERMIGHDPDFYLEHLLARWAGDVSALDRHSVDAYRVAFRRPSVIDASCEDYRAGAGIDVEHDRTDRDAGRTIACPTLMLWGRDYMSDKVASPETIWRAWAPDLRVKALDCGHFLMEEEPEAVTEALLEFFGA